MTFAATVTGNAPTGSVTFADGGVAIGGCSTVALSGTGDSRIAGCSIASLAVGTHSIVAAYGGDGRNTASQSAPLSQQIEPVTLAAASFVGTDATTQGNWRGRYGADGYAVFSDRTSFPAYAAVSAIGKNDYVWAASTTETRAAAREHRAHRRVLVRGAELQRRRQPHRRRPRTR